MSWINFLTVIFIVYLVYYCLNLFYDLFLSPRVPLGEICEDELFFTETYTPELITAKKMVEPVFEDPEREKPIVYFPSGPINASGGISLKHLFSLAKDNLIEHTRTIPY
ncbi:hypothetical protein ASU31_00150 [Pedobacter ginsenosidimutans]|uniref:Uncharacterized protein n=1 Tax=Pedobacter ginsenosidimutans TaxID=687842 RepID=A0A0T5VV29_9SPHI|nr:hypothetical protein [Pedobacter ginsenosidimutans]KRT17745.1 hypothetical protein ASU31_00150 [Pedobacter ginsenosidimutans]